jgi:hypothetical protein
MSSMRRGDEIPYRDPRPWRRACFSWRHSRRRNDVPYLLAMNMIANSDGPGTGSRFTGTRSDMLFMYGVFGLVLVFGLTSLVAGLWQLIFGKRNMMLVWIMLSLGAIFFFIGMAVQYLN